MGQTASKSTSSTITSNNGDTTINLKKPEIQPYTVDTNNWLQYAKDKLRGDIKGELLIGPNTLLGDPAKGCSKNFNASYKCFNNGETKTISIPESADGKTAIFTCENEYKQCTSSILEITDDGKLRMKKDGINGEIIWQSNTNEVGLPTEKYSAKYSKYGRNYLKTDEFLKPGEFVGSPSGNCYFTLMPVQENSDIYRLVIAYRELGCKNEESNSRNKNLEINSSSYGSFGFVGDTNTTYGLYSLEPMELKDMGKVAYVDGNENGETGTKKNIYTYDDNNSSLSNQYFYIGKYNALGNNIDILDSNSIEKCIELCNKNDKCYSFVYDKVNNKCYLKNDSSFPYSSNRTYDENMELYIRKKKVDNNISCSKDVKQITYSDFQSFNRKGNMNNDIKCNIGKQISEDKELLRKKREELDNILKDMNQHINALQSKEEKIDNELILYINKLENDIKNYDVIFKKSKDIVDETINAKAQYDNSELKISSTNTYYMIFTIILIVIIISMIILFRKIK